MLYKVVSRSRGGIGGKGLRKESLKAKEGYLHRQSIVSICCPRGGTQVMRIVSSKVLSGEKSTGMSWHFQGFLGRLSAVLAGLGEHSARQLNGLNLFSLDAIWHHLLPHCCSTHPPPLDQTSP